MANNDVIQEIIGKVIADPEFRASVIADAESAIKVAGFSITEEQLAAIKAIDFSGTIEGLDERISKCVPL